MHKHIQTYKQTIYINKEQHSSNTYLHTKHNTSKHAHTHKTICHTQQLYTTNTSTKYTTQTQIGDTHFYMNIYTCTRYTNNIYNIIKHQSHTQNINICICQTV